jgi:hypothetical protein
MNGCCRRKTRLKESTGRGWKKSYISFRYNSVFIMIVTGAGYWMLDAGATTGFGEVLVFWAFFLLLRFSEKFSLYVSSIQYPASNICI